MNKHTPGPWTARPHSKLDDFIVGADGTLIKPTNYEELERATLEANFRLMIAAAPDMLAALEAFQSAIWAS